MPVSLVFVFDGHARPSLKCDTNVGFMPHWLTSYFREFLEAFGFYIYDAPSEAEAELAELNRNYVIDFVLTSNNDVFVFGATHVIHSPQDKKKADSVEIYVRQPAAMESMFMHAGCFFIAVLVGGDYDTVGLHGCGPAIASGLASTQLAPSLFHAATVFDDDELNCFLVEWRVRLRRELSEDPDGVLKQCHRMLAASIPDSFPDPGILRLYTKPATMSRLGELVPSAHWEKPGNLDITQIIGLLDLRFGWGDDIFNKLLKYVWDGCCIRDLVKSCFLPALSQSYLGLPVIRHITWTAVKIQSTTAPPSYFVEVWLTKAMDAVAAAFEALHLSACHGSYNISTCVWVPAPIIMSAAADKVDKFHMSSRKILITPSVPYVPVCIPNGSMVTPTSALAAHAETVSAASDTSTVSIQDSSAASSSTLPTTNKSMILDLTIEEDLHPRREQLFIDLTTDDDKAGTDPFQNSEVCSNYGKGKQKKPTEVIDLTG
ncbi:DNA repair protein rad13 [Hypsizygus marmoreus]|uniref:DNA repair protein rad13 n=1 Tax=Hypsizygus marmoreus TaxID=39966 RepID=A0A369JBY4_HYPMA|nr:DNA repair protein rad13 [Hypsizygus marmoreus]